MAEFKFNCPKCNGEFTADSSLVGKLAECSQCKTRIRIPNPNVPTDEATIVLNSSKPQTKGPSNLGKSIIQITTTKGLVNILVARDERPGPIWISCSVLGIKAKCYHVYGILFNAKFVSPQAIETAHSLGYDLTSEEGWKVVIRDKDKIKTAFDSSGKQLTSQLDKQLPAPAINVPTDQATIVHNSSRPQTKEPFVIGKPIQISTTEGSASILLDKPGRVDTRCGILGIKEKCYFAGLKFISPQAIETAHSLGYDLSTKEGLSSVFKDKDKIRAAFDPTGKLPKVNSLEITSIISIALIVLAGIIFVGIIFVAWNVLSPSIPDDMSGAYKCYKNANVMGSYMTLNATLLINKSSDNKWTYQYMSVATDAMSGGSKNESFAGSLNLEMKRSDTYIFDLKEVRVVLKAYISGNTNNWKIEWGWIGGNDLIFDKQ